MSRLIEQSLANKTFKYSYDANSNRLTRNQTVNGTATTENYTIQSGNNRINTITQGTNSKTYSYLATGQITSDGVRSYTYNAQGRSESISTGTNSSFNIYDAFGQRIQKIGSNAGNQTLFVYDENGQLLGEYTPQGQVIREYIWLENRLVGLRSYQYPNEILRVHTDHLGTPRAISNNQNQILWRWEGDQFGDVLPTGNLTFPIRHAGQYYDSETGIFYNYFRDYDPVTGRYVESDPIGLDGGLNTYGYVGGNALLFVDPTGESPRGGERGASGGVGGQNSANPYKHCREFNPPQRNAIECKHHQSGKWVKKPRPPEMPFPEPDPITCGENCQKKAYVVIGSTGGAYIIYRCIRMVPSLYPPLWWSIPGNIAAP